MDIILHGGKCCGIKTIYGFQYHPDSMMGEREESVVLPYEGGTYTNGGGRSFFKGTAPKETAGKRFIRFVEQCKARRPSHLIEVTLSGELLLNWEDFIEELGFEKVSTFENCNSGHLVAVYHYSYKGSKTAEYRTDVDEENEARLEALSELKLNTEGED